jgi:GDPmannose 4,6-dehydratase
MKHALITGANGQDGVLLGRYLRSLGYAVTGMVRGLDRVLPVGVHRCLLPGPENWEPVLAELQPDEIYHLGGDSFAGKPQEGAVRLLESNVMLTARLLEAAQRSVPQVRVFVAGSAVAFGDPPTSPQDEDTPRAAVSLYGASKALLHPLAEEYRKSDLFVRIGILFNHESCLRPERFVTRKITAAVARIAEGLQSELRLGNLDVTRDWGHAEDFVRAMHLMLQSGVVEDRVIATGTGRTVREFCAVAFGAVGLDYQRYVRMAPEFWRPAEVVPLVGDSRRLREETGWEPGRSFESLVQEMVAYDMKRVTGEGSGWKLVSGRWVLDDGQVRLEGSPVSPP